MIQISKHVDPSAMLLRGFVGSIILVLASSCGLAMDNEDRLDRAEQAYAEGDYQTAIIDTKSILLDEPNNIRARRLLGRATVETGDGAGAEKELRRAIELGTEQVEVAAELGRALVLQRKWNEILSDIPLSGYPSSEAEASARVSHGDAYMAQNQPDSARELYSSALQLWPEYLDAQLGVISSHIAEENYLQASSEIQHVLENNPENPRVWIFSGEFNNRVREFEQAESNFNVALDRATAQDSRDYRLQAIAGLAISLLGQEEVETARAHIEQLNREAPQLLQTKILVARLAFIDQDWTILQQVAQQILQVAPNYRPAIMLLGAAHLNSGSLTQAETYFSEAVASEPDDVIARQMLVETRLQLRKADEAQEVLAPILGSQSADPVSIQLAARASLSKGEIEEALTFLRRNVEENPGNTNMRLQLASILIQSGESVEAQAILDEIDISDSDESAYVHDMLIVMTKIRDQDATTALNGAKQLVQDHGSQAGAYDLLGSLQLSQGDIESASDAFEKSLTINPDGLLARRYLAEIDESKGDLDKAESRYDSALAEDPDAAWAIYGLGRIAYRRADFDNAIANFRRALNLNPSNPVYQLSLARAEVGTGNPGRAIRTLEKNTQVTLGHTPSAVLLGTLKARSGDIDGAIDVAEELQARNPQSPSARALEGEIRLIGNDLMGANSAYDKAVVMGPVKSHVLRSYGIKRQLSASDAEKPLVGYLDVRPLDSQVRITLAEYYMSVGRKEESIALYEQIVTAEPTNAFALNNLAWAYHQSGDSRALDLAHRARAAMPDNGSIVDTLGWILTETGSIDEGEAVLREAVELSNGKSEIRFHHAVALERLGNVDEARAVLVKALDSDTEFPSRENAEQMLADL